MTPEVPAVAEPAPATPGSLLVTFAGLHLRGIGGWIAVADLLALLAAAGQPPTAVRQALVRLKSRDFLSSETRAGRAGYGLTDAAVAELAGGDARIFRFGQASDDQGWVLAIFSVPEEARAERHRLRRALSWWGFGTVAAGVWIAPEALADRAKAHLQAAGLDGYVTWFTGRSAGPAEVSRWWDLEALRLLYDEFLQRWSTAPVPTTDEEEFAAHLHLVDSWRRFPRIDPGLPAGLLPADWQGRRAFDTFTRLREQWADPADRFVRASVAAADRTG